MCVYTETAFAFCIFVLFGSPVHEMQGKPGKINETQ